MSGRTRPAVAALACLALGIALNSQPAGQTGAKTEPAALAARPAIPEFWSTALLEDYELPLATPSRRPSSP